jgi:membrane associated rhomboid family serine protease
MFNVPRVVTALLGLLVAIHVARLFLDEQQDLWFVLAMALIPARYAGAAEALPGGEPAALTSFVTHMLVHGDAMHLMFNGAWLLAFGGLLAQRLGAARLIAFSVFTGVAGAVAFLLANPGLMAPVIGASGAVSGLMGGTMRLLFPALDQGGLWTLREYPEDVTLMGLADAMRDRRMQLTVAVFVAVNLLALVGLGGVAEGAIAWEAHLGGFAAGLACIGLFDRRRRAADQQPKIY